MSQSTPPPAAIRKLPVLETVAAAYRTVFSQPGTFVRAAFLPFLITLVLVALATYNLHKPGVAQFISLLSLIPYTLFCVAWHRLTLLGPAAGPPALLPTWQRRHWRFLSWMLVLMLITVTLLLPFTFVAAYLPQGGGAAEAMSPAMALLGIAIVIATFIALIHVMLRLSFVFPAASVDETYRLSDSWNHTRGQVLRLFGTILLAMLPLLPVWLLARVALFLLVGPETPEADLGDITVEEDLENFLSENGAALVFVNTLVAAAHYLSLALLVSIYSSAFRSLTGWIPESAATVPTSYEPKD